MEIQNVSLNTADMLFLIVIGKQGRSTEER